MPNFKEQDQSVKEFVVEKAYLQFIFPFALKKDGSDNLIQQLQQQGYEFFTLDNAHLQDKYYGEHTVLHYHMEKIFLPNIEPIIFPSNPKKKEGFRRFSKTFNQEYFLKGKYLQTNFQLLSIDIIICPFQIGMMNIRVGLPDNMNYSEVLEFTDLFRVMEPFADKDSNIKVGTKSQCYKEIKDFIFELLCPFMKDFLDQKNINSSYFGSLPFYIDERLYVIGYIALQEESKLDIEEIYRLGNISGFDNKGHPFIGAENPAYMKRFYDTHVYDRWADETYYVVTDYTFSCITKSQGELTYMLANQMFGQYYYSFLLFYYYRIALMKLNYDQRKIHKGIKGMDVDNLIMQITEFSAKIYNIEINSRLAGKEISNYLKKVLNIDKLFAQVNNTLNDLYKNEERMASKRHNYLLQILTVYTVISGIYGMNLVIHNWEGKIAWNKLSHYTIFEYIALFVALSGIIISTVMAIQAVRSYIRAKKRSKKNYL
ncbi:hypothetical protein P4678_27400 [Priestia megaterium]|uniref:hypothetical protein n=1 Tax=Priestia megaterium TaxID=1404 RepID=UPI002E244FA9|nr:hypothetical protein [Priestia megaterium]MED4298329.1 hypothetical protein [Priestia megaterium]